MALRSQALAGQQWRIEFACARQYVIGFFREVRLCASDATVLSWAPAAWLSPSVITRERSRGLRHLLGVHLTAGFLHKRYGSRNSKATVLALAPSYGRVVSFFFAGCPVFLAAYLRIHKTYSVILDFFCVFIYVIFFLVVVHSDGSFTPQECQCFKCTLLAF